MSGKEMASDINKAIASGGYVIVTEKAVDGAGRNAIYVYMTYNAQDGYQTWKISGGLNGGIFAGLPLWAQIIIPIVAVVILALVLPSLATFLGFSALLGTILAGVLGGFLSALITIDNTLCAFKDPKDSSGASLLGFILMVTGAVSGAFGRNAAAFTQAISASIATGVAGMDSGLCSDQKYKDRLDMLDEI